MTPRATSHRNELIVLALIGGGMILTVILVIVGIFGWWESKTIISNADGMKQPTPLPNWAENVLVSIISIFAVKIGDVLAALVTLATGRQVETMGERLATSTPAKPARAQVEAVEEQIEEAVDHVVDATVEAGEEARP